MTENNNKKNTEAKTDGNKLSTNGNGRRILPNIKLRFWWQHGLATEFDEMKTFCLILFRIFFSVFVLVVWMPPSSVVLDGNNGGEREMCMHITENRAKWESDPNAPSDLIRRTQCQRAVTDISITICKWYTVIEFPFLCPFHLILYLSMCDGYTMQNAPNLFICCVCVFARSHRIFEFH